MFSKKPVNHKRLYIAIIAVGLMTVFSITCSSGDWLDDGEKYLCPECREVYGSELVPCQHCGINPTPYNYCYDCAKELNRCQLCGRSRLIE